MTFVVQEFLDAWQDFEIGPYPKDAHFYWVIAEALIKEVPGLRIKKGKVILYLAGIDAQNIDLIYIIPCIWSCAN